MAASTGGGAGSGFARFTITENTLYMRLAASCCHSKLVYTAHIPVFAEEQFPNQQAKHQ